MITMILLECLSEIQRAIASSMGHLVYEKMSFEKKTTSNGGVFEKMVIKMNLYQSKNVLF
jgi:hypothetical protein